MEDILKLFFKKFNSFTEEEAQAIIDHTELVTCKKGESIAQQGKICAKCFFILKGCVRRYQLIDGQEKTTGFFLEGDPIVFYSSYIHQAPSNYYLSCIEDSILLVGTREKELELHKAYPKIETHLMYELMLQDYEKIDQYTILLHSYKPEERYVMLLKSQPEIFNRVPLLYIASFLGVTPESYSRIRKRIMLRNL